MPAYNSEKFLKMLFHITDKHSHMEQKNQGKEFPLDALNPQLREIILALTSTLGFNLDYISTAFLAAFSAAIGKTYELKVKPTWTERANLFILLVGPPGVNKSAPMSFAFKLLEEISLRAITGSINGVQWTSTYDYMFSTSLANEITTRLVVNNITIEALLEVMSEDNTRLLMYSDEAAAVFKNFGRYSKGGSDIEYFLQFYSGMNATKDRVTSGVKAVERPVLTFAGTIQPDVLRTVFKKVDDNGFFERFLFAHPDVVVRKGLSSEVLEESTVTAYRNTVDKLLSLEMKDGRSTVLEYSREAFARMLEWSDENAQKINNDESQRKTGIRSKMEIVLHRVALLIEIVNCVINNEQIDQVSLNSLKSSIAIVEYFQYMAEKTMALNSDDPLERLDEQKRKFYLSLPEKFQTFEAVRRGELRGIPERTVKEFLRNKDLFKRVKMGHYERLL